MIRRRLSLQLILLSIPFTILQVAAVSGVITMTLSHLGLPAYLDALMRGRLWLWNPVVLSLVYALNILVGWVVGNGEEPASPRR